MKKKWTKKEQKLLEQLVYLTELARKDRKMFEFVIHNEPDPERRVNTRKFVEWMLGERKNPY